MIDNYLVYRHTSPSGKSYIGQTNNLKRRNYQHRVRNHCTYFHRAIKKYGWNNFTHDILKEGLTLEESNYWEQYYIKQYNTLIPNGYNLTTGGLNCEHSKETKLKRSLSRRNRIQPKHTEEAKQKISLSHMGMKHTELSKKWMSIVHTGFKHTEESKQKMSAVKKGIPLTEEHKRKLRKKHKPIGKQPIASCPHCGKVGGINGLKRWHFDKCKLKNNG